MKSNYTLRKAAGSYWLLDLAQDGKDYRRPLELNESGALLWKRFCEGDSVKEAAAALCREYGILSDEAAADTVSFLDGLRAAGIDTEFMDISEER